MKVYQCLNCDTECEWSHRKVNKYCSNKCQGEYQARQRLETWLKTGEGSSKGPRKAWLLEQQNNCCAICGMKDEWNGKSIVFIMDHIDGNSENNAKENLRCVCPNCDSQLDTYKAKNRGNGRHSRRQRYADGKSY